MGPLAFGLTVREELVLRYRWGFITGKKETLKATADQFGLSRERIRQQEKSALRKILGVIYGPIEMPQKPFTFLGFPVENHKG